MSQNEKNQPSAKDNTEKCTRRTTAATQSKHVDDNVQLHSLNITHFISGKRYERKECKVSSNLDAGLHLLGLMARAHAHGVEEANDAPNQAQRSLTYTSASLEYFKTRFIDGVDANDVLPVDLVHGWDYIDEADENENIIPWQLSYGNRGSGHIVNIPSSNMFKINPNAKPENYSKFQRRAAKALILVFAFVCSFAYGVYTSSPFLLKKGCAMQPYCRAIMFKETRDVVGLYKGGRKEIGY